MSVTAKRITDLKDRETCDFCEEMELASIALVGDGPVYEALADAPAMCLECARQAIASLTAMVQSIEGTTMSRDKAADMQRRALDGFREARTTMPRVSRKVMRKK